MNELRRRAETVAKFIKHRLLNYLGFCQSFFQPVVVVVDARPKGSGGVPDILVNLFCQGGGSVFATIIAVDQEIL